MCFRRRIHVQNVGERSGNNSTTTTTTSSTTADRQNGQPRNDRENAPPHAATTNNFHRNLVYTISEAVMDALNNAQLSRAQGTEGTNTIGSNQNAANQTPSTLRQPIHVPPPFVGLMPHIQNMVNEKSKLYLKS